MRGNSKDFFVLNPARPFRIFGFLKRRRCGIRLGGILRDEHGFTSVGMAVSIFLCVSLIFTSAQVYRVSSASAEIQEVADASALAASNEVAEYVSAVNVCDAGVLSLTLLSGTLFGFGIVAACVPPLAPLSEKLIESANQIIDKRDAFYEGAVKGLNAIQKLLPFLASVNAMGVAKANNEGAMQAAYFVLPALIPQVGSDFESPEDDGLRDFSEDVDEDIDAIKEDSAIAEEMSEKASAERESAYLHDCGFEPDFYCMYNRAKSLSDISWEDNAYYAASDAWTFPVALKRIRAYYASRKSDGIETSGSIEKRADSAIRKRFYEYAAKQFESAYINDEEDSFSYSLPQLFKNTDEMKSTELYTEAIYPVTQNGAELTMHAWSGCPNAKGAIRSGSISEMDSGSFVTCAKCEFTVSSMGKVASASTNIDTGFEYHYERFRQAVERYASVREELDRAKKSVKDKVNPLFDTLKSILQDAVAKRLVADPPGKNGVVLMAVNTAKPAADSGFQSLFVKSGTTLGTTAAVSASTLVKDTSTEGSSIITRIVGNLVEDLPLLGDFADVIANCWTDLLRAYEDGQDALNDAVDTFSDFGSTITHSGLGSWAKYSFKSIVNEIGLQPADIDPRMPVLVNSAHVASGDDSFSTSFTKVKQGALSGSTPSTGLFSALSSIAADGLGEKTDSTWVNVSTFTDSDTGQDYSIEWALPGSGESSPGILDGVVSSLQQGISQLDPVRSWQ